MNFSVADFLIQSGLASQVRFHGKRFAWFVSDVTRKDWNWLLNTMVYGQLFPTATEQERESLRRLGERWKQYEKEGKWVMVLFIEVSTPVRVCTMWQRLGS